MNLSFFHVTLNFYLDRWKFFSVSFENIWPLVANSKKNTCNYDKTNRLPLHRPKTIFFSNQTLYYPTTVDRLYLSWLILSCSIALLQTVLLGKKAFLCLFKCQNLPKIVRKCQQQTPSFRIKQVSSGGSMLWNFGWLAIRYCLQLQNVLY